MNYGGLPKGLLKFHKYADGSRTPLEEQMTEGIRQQPIRSERSIFTSLFRPITASFSRRR